MNNILRIWVIIVICSCNSNESTILEQHLVNNHKLDTIYLDTTPSISNTLSEKRNLWEGVKINGFSFFYDCSGCKTSNNDYMNIMAINQTDTIRVLYLPVIDFFVSDVKLLYINNQHFISVHIKTHYEDPKTLLFSLNADDMKTEEVNRKSIFFKPFRYTQIEKSTGVNYLNSNRFVDSIYTKQIIHNDTQILGYEVVYQLQELKHNNFSLKPISQKVLEN